MGRKIGSVISPPPRFHRFIKLWEYCPLSLPRKKGKKQTNKQRYKQKNKQNKTENKNRKYTHFDSKKPSKTLWRMSHNFLPCCHSLIGTWLSKTWQRGVATWLCFSLIVRHAWLQLSHVISCLCWHGGISCDIFASCFTSICLYTKKLSIFKTTSFFGVSTLKRLSYNRTSETFQSISVLYKKDMRSNWCFNFKMLLFRKFVSYFHSLIVILRSCVMKLNRFSVSFSSFSRSNQEVYVRILARRVLGL